MLIVPNNKYFFILFILYIYFNIFGSVPTTNDVSNPVAEAIVNSFYKASAFGS